MPSSRADRPDPFAEFTASVRQAADGALALWRRNHGGDPDPLDSHAEHVAYITWVRWMVGRKIPLRSLSRDEIHQLADAFRRRFFRQHANGAGDEA